MIINRSEKNPILAPNKNHSWEAEAVFNGCPIQRAEKTYLIYRAMSLPHYRMPVKDPIAISDIGIAESNDGVFFSDRKRLIMPEQSWETFGCEDPRVTEIDGMYYIFYTALSKYPFHPDGIRVGLAISDNLRGIREKHLVTPFNAKGMALFPEKINGKYWTILTADTDKPPAKISLASFDKIEEIWSQDYWNKWYKEIDKHTLHLSRDGKDQVEVGSPPIKTQRGWLVLYSHIQNYFSRDRLFAIEAVLLDLENPKKVIGRTKVPLLTPEEYYERFGLVPNVVFPSGAMISGSQLRIYYGAADTVCAMASVDLSDLIDHMTRTKDRTAKFKRYDNNPIIKPKKENSWESRATFNPAALEIDKKVHIVYRAMSEDNTSVMGHAISEDGFNVSYRSDKPIYVPREFFEDKKTPGGNSGCEDPRLTEIDGTVFMCYTAFDGQSPPRVALTTISKDDFLAENWNKWSKAKLISPPGIDDKDAFVFPEKVHGKYMIIHRSGDDIDIAFRTTFDFKENEWLEEYRWIAPRKGWWDSKKVGAAGPPIKTEKGWIMLYHGVSDNGIYRVGAVLLGLENPVEILARTDEPLFEPEALYEKEGQIPNVVFPCGNIIRDNKLFIYYGGADEVVGVATIELKDLFEDLYQSE